jgi:hypothetical protein
MPMGKKVAVPDGAAFGRWTVIREVAKRKTARIFLCRCECGTERPVPMGHLRNRTSRSCGCAHRGNKHAVHVQPPEGRLGQALADILKRDKVSPSKLGRWMGWQPIQVFNLLNGIAHPLPGRIDIIAAALALSERDLRILHLAAARDRGYRI